VFHKCDFFLFRKYEEKIFQVRSENLSLPLIYRVFTNSYTKPL
jgi:hypothetical protein